MDHDRVPNTTGPAAHRPTGWVLVRVPLLAGAVALLAIAAAPHRSASGATSAPPAWVLDAGGCEPSALPPGHPPVAGFAMALPPGHPPIGGFALALPPGHPPVAGFARTLPPGHPPVGERVGGTPFDVAPPAAPLFEPPPTVEL